MAASLAEFLSAYPTAGIGSGVPKLSTGVSGQKLIILRRFLFGSDVASHRFALIWSIGGFLTISITLLACAAPNYATPKYVFATFINTTGWPDGIAWLLSLLQGGLGLTGFDAVADMIEEIPNAAIEGPKIIINCQYIGINSLYLNVGIVTIFGCIYLGSTTAFNAIIAFAVTTLGLSYGIPIALNFIYMRQRLPERAFTLPSWLGWTLNIIGLFYTIVTTFLFLLLPSLPVSGTSMNYCVVALAIILLISIFQWFVNGRKNFAGPRITIHGEIIEEVIRP
ncbi:hypothetical protein BKA67DRAFT_532769 [Truncatella angustata]|uniref:Uncharacterized protein n=1 Tax=Truncatella angustata TaxID=152316 RepID=A0A9P8USJ9_9PEZI|nr:uncharacterized protein BKA67DRAFT_532769 [Truncatella angustata]KAH6657569.1 hypothetical protein BKA67DRAFT_532769 [Truncatella angustata]